MRLLVPYRNWKSLALVWLPPVFILCLLIMGWLRNAVYFEPFFSTAGGLLFLIGLKCNILMGLVLHILWWLTASERFKRLHSAGRLALMILLGMVSVLLGLMALSIYGLGPAGLLIYQDY